jgi:hypothetical protein
MQWRARAVAATRVTVRCNCSFGDNSILHGFDGCEQGAAGFQSDTIVIHG